MKILNSFFIVVILILDSIYLQAQNDEQKDFSFLVKKIDSNLKIDSQKNKWVLIKRKEVDSIYWYYLRRDFRDLMGAQIRDKKSGTLFEFFFLEGNLAKVIFQPKRENKKRTGGVYYFSDRQLIFKEEYNISPFSIETLIMIADKLKLTSATIN